MAMDLDGKTVLVVGATGGIGRATAEAFIHKGAKVTLAGRDKAKVNEVAAAVGGIGAVIDILDNATIETFFANAQPFDHIVVAAAQTKRGPVGELPLDDAKAAMESKFWGAYRVARAAKVKDGGSISFISGIFAQRPTAATALQGSINAAIDALARGLALERAPVRVNTVSPGIINTPLWHEMPEADRHSLFQDTAGKLPARRIGEADDVAQAILFVATNPFVTGATIQVDGGAALV